MQEKSKHDIEIKSTSCVLSSLIESPSLFDEQNERSHRDKLSRKKAKCSWERGTDDVNQRRTDAKKIRRGRGCNRTKYSEWHAKQDEEEDSCVTGFSLGRQTCHPESEGNRRIWHPFFIPEVLSKTTKMTTLTLVTLLDFFVSISRLSSILCVTFSRRLILR